MSDDSHRKLLMARQHADAVLTTSQIRLCYDRCMTSANDLSELKQQRVKLAADLASVDHAIASLEALEHSQMVDASCPHCDFVVENDGGMTIHLRDVHPNPLIYPDARPQ
jgi:hypothetical protein